MTVALQHLITGLMQNWCLADMRAVLLRHRKERIGIAKTIGGESGTARVREASLKLSLVRDLSEPGMFPWCKMELRNFI